MHRKNELNFLSRVLFSVLLQCLVQPYHGQLDDVTKGTLDQAVEELTLSPPHLPLLLRVRVDQKIPHTAHTTEDCADVRNVSLLRCINNSLLETIDLRECLLVIGKELLCFFNCHLQHIR